jgi:hypothetical protein
VLTALLVVPVVVLLALPFGPASLAGWVVIFTALAFASLDAAGLAGRMSRQAGEAEHTRPGQSSLGAFVRAAIIMELAAAFPVIGWFGAIPLMTITALGATVFALLHSVPAQAAASVVVSGLGAAATLPQG